MSNDRTSNDVQTAEDLGDGYVPDSSSSDSGKSESGVTESGVTDAGALGSEGILNPDGTLNPDETLNPGGTLLGVAPIRADALPVATAPVARQGETLIGTPVISTPMTSTPMTSTPIIGATVGDTSVFKAFSPGNPSFPVPSAPSPPPPPQPGETMIGVAPVAFHPNSPPPSTLGSTALESGGTMIGIAPLGRVDPSPSLEAMHSNAGAPEEEPGGTMIGIAPVQASVGAIAAPAPTPIMRRVGPPAAYEILAHIGGGEFGQVFRARPRPLGEPAGGIADGEAEVALRLIRPELSDDPQAMSVLRDVVALAQNARHPHLGRQLGLDESASPTLVLELVQGRQLLDLMRQRGRAPAAAVVDLGLRLCSALAVAHAAGLAHGRIHAGNVVLEAQTGRWVLLDLGHAYLNQDLDPLHDLYALAALLYEMATGRQPFAEGEFEAPDPRTYAPDLPDAVSELLLRSLSPDPDRWYGSALELSQALAASKRHG